MYLNNSCGYMKKHCNEYCIKHNRIPISKKEKKENTTKYPIKADKIAK